MGKLWNLMAGRGANESKAKKYREKSKFQRNKQAELKRINKRARKQRARARRKGNR